VRGGRRDGSSSGGGDAVCSKITLSNLVPLYVMLITAVDTNTAVVYTVNDQSKPSSSLILLFGNPNDYAPQVKLNNLDSVNSLISSRYLTNTIHDRFRAVAVDSQTTRIYYGNNDLGTIEYSLHIVKDNIDYNFFFAPPITKVVSLTAVSLQLTLLFQIFYCCNVVSDK